MPVGVRKLHVKFFARSSLEIYQTVRIDYHSFLSRVRISVRPIELTIEFISIKATASMLYCTQICKKRQNIVNTQLMCSVNTVMYLHYNLYIVDEMGNT